MQNPKMGERGFGVFKNLRGGFWGWSGGKGKMGCSCQACPQGMGKELDLLYGQPLGRGPAGVGTEAGRSVRRLLPVSCGDLGMLRLGG